MLYTGFYSLPFMTMEEELCRPPEIPGQRKSFDFMSLLQDEFYAKFCRKFHFLKRHINKACCICIDTKPVQCHFIVDVLPSDVLSLAGVKTFFYDNLYILQSIKV